VARFWVRLSPRATVDRIVGIEQDGALHVRVRAAPADGTANAALVQVLATALDVPRSALSIVAGASSRRKLVELDDDRRDRLAQVWPELLR
jgi:uncharacterized protein (TIGR00251 family)